MLARGAGSPIVLLHGLGCSHATGQAWPDGSHAPIACTGMRVPRRQARPLTGGQCAAHGSAATSRNSSTTTCSTACCSSATRWCADRHAVPRDPRHVAPARRLPRRSVAARGHRRRLAPRSVGELQRRDAGGTHRRSAQRLREHRHARDRCAADRGSARFFSRRRSSAAICAIGWPRARSRRCSTSARASSSRTSDAGQTQPAALVVLGGRSAHYAQVPLEDYYRRTVVGAQVLRYELSGHSPHVAEPARFAHDLLEFSDALAELRRAQPKLRRS